MFNSSQNLQNFLSDLFYLVISVLSLLSLYLQKEIIRTKQMSMLIYAVIYVYKKYKK